MARPRVTPVSFLWDSSRSDTVAMSSLRFSCTSIESHGSSAAFTSHSIEDGSVITDHVRPDLETLSIEVLVSNASNGPYRDVDNDQFSEIELTPDPVTSSNVDRTNDSENQFTETVERVSDVYEKLRELNREGVIIDLVTTSLRAYTSMVITDIQTTRSHQNTDSMVLSVNLKQVELATLEVENGNVPFTARGSKRKGAGSKSTDEANGAEKEKAEEKRSSLLLNILS